MTDRVAIKASLLLGLAMICATACSSPRSALQIGQAMADQRAREVAATSGVPLTAPDALARAVSVPERPAVAMPQVEVKERKLEPYVLVQATPFTGPPTLQLVSKRVTGDRPRLVWADPGYSGRFIVAVNGKKLGEISIPEAVRTINSAPEPVYVTIAARGELRTIDCYTTREYVPVLNLPKEEGKGPLSPR